jgi:hypothetical protein
MSKKTKRQIRKPAGSPAPVAADSITSTNGSRPFDRDFNPDYTPVIKDLRRIGMLAGSFFVILIVLAFFLR